MKVCSPASNPDMPAALALQGWCFMAVNLTGSRLFAFISLPCIKTTMSSGPTQAEMRLAAVRYLRIFYVKDRTPLQHAEDAAWVIAFLGYWEASVQDTKGTLKVEM